MTRHNITKNKTKMDNKLNCNNIIDTISLLYWFHDMVFIISLSFSLNLISCINNVIPVN